MDDILETAKLISFREKNKTEPAKSQFREIQTGIRSFSNFLFSGNFRIEDAINASAKTAYLAAKLKQKDFLPIERFTDKDILDLIIEKSGLDLLKQVKKTT